MTEKTKIDIALLLPTVPDAHDSCMRRLSDLLKAKDGVETAHLVEDKLNGRNEICIHYDPNRLTIGGVRDLAGRAGLGMVAFLVPATVLGLRLGPAVLLHEGSTLLVVLNALRLLAYQGR